MKKYENERLTMMPPRKKCKRTFQFSGFNEYLDNKALLVKYTIELGGTYYETESLHPQCTHLITTLLTRTEKCLSACASGLWILTANYIFDSYEAGEWLSEENYEWNRERISLAYPANISKLIQTAPERNRKLVEQTQMKRFQNWIAFVKLNNKRNEEVYIRILACGGATIRKVLNSTDITYFFIEKENVTSFESKICYPALFLSTNYVRNYLLQELIPEPEQFLLGNYSPASDPLLSMKPLNTFHPTFPTITRLFLPVERCSDDSMTDTNDPIPSCSIPRKRREPSDEPLQNHGSSCDGNWITKFSNKRLLTLQNKFTSVDCLSSLRSRLWDTPYKVSVDHTCYSNQKDEKKGKPEAIEYPHALASMFDCCMEESNPGSALNFLASVISPEWFPPPRIVSTLISLLLNVHENPTVQHSAKLALLNVIDCHLPVTKAINAMYLEALSQRNGTESNAWSLFSDVIGTCLQNPDKHSCQSLLKLLTEVLERNFINFLENTQNPSRDLSSPNSCPLVCHVMWPSGPVGSVNKNCKELITFLGQSLKHEDLYVTLLKVQKLFCVVAECIRLTNVLHRSHKHISTRSPNCKVLTKEVLNICLVSFNEKEQIMEFLVTLGSPWLKMMIAEKLLCDLIFESSDNEDTLSLKKIITYYMFPDFSKTSVKQKSNLCITKLQKLSVSQHQKSGENARQIAAVNCRNRKGETPVHVACMENRVARLRDYLSVPGVDINVKDYMGWTPLHEACNHGNVQCVKMLLEWRPHPDFMPPNEQHRTCFVDLKATDNDNNNGITPLHDAVNNNHVKVAKLLLKYGGSSLLTLKSKKNFTPMELVRTEEMRSVLCANYSSDSTLNDSQTSFTECVESDESGDEYQHSRFPQFTSELCIEFLDYLKCLSAAYMKWNNLPELHKSLKVCCSEKQLPDFDLFQEVYFCLFGFVLSSSTEMKRIWEDLQLMPELMVVYYPKLESHVHKLTGQKATHFLPELLAIEILFTL